MKAVNYLLGVALLAAAFASQARAEDDRTLEERAWINAGGVSTRSASTSYEAVRPLPRFTRSAFVATGGGGPTWSGAPLGAPADPCGADPRCCSYGDWWNECRWGAEISLAAWLPGLYGTLGIGPHNLDVDISPGDLLDNLDTLLGDLEFFLQGGIGVQYGRWRLGLSVNAAELGDTFQTKLAGRSANVDLTLVNWQANLYYRAGMSRFGCSPCPQLLVYEPYIGVRGMYIEADASLDPVINLSPDEHWVDPVVGAKLTWDFRNRWAIELEGDVGGFGVSSDFTWKLRAGVGWRFARMWHLRAGWLVIDTDYETGSGSSRFKWDVTQSGPYLEVGFSF